MTMNNISIYQLKMNPSKAIKSAVDYPLAVASRNKVKAYLEGKDLYEKMLLYIEEYIDAEAVRGADVKKGRDFEEVVEELGI